MGVLALITPKYGGVWVKWLFRAGFVYNRNQIIWVAVRDSSIQVRTTNDASTSIEVGL